MERKKIRQWVGGFSLLIVLGCVLWRYAYPMAIAASTAPPESWKRAASAKTRADVYALLGRPDESACAKEYENYLVDHWWGTEQLKVIAQGCELDGKLDSVYYIQRVDGFYEPAASERLK